IWPEVHVNEAVLKDCIRQLRQALNDDAKTPRFIETSHRRGYRFIASFVEAEQATLTPYTSAPALPVTSEKILGRDAALTQLQRWLDDAFAGNSQTVFVTGEEASAKLPSSNRFSNTPARTSAFCGSVSRTVRIR